MHWGSHVGLPVRRESRSGEIFLKIIPYVLRCEYFEAWGSFRVVYWWVLQLSLKSRLGTSKPY